MLYTIFPISGKWSKCLKGQIAKSKISCMNSNQNIDDHLAQVDVMVNIGLSAIRKIKDMYLEEGDKE